MNLSRCLEAGVRTLILVVGLLVTSTQAFAQENPAKELKGDLPWRVEGRVSIADPRHPALKRPHKAFTLTLKKGQGYVIEAKSKDFDTFLQLEDAAGKKLAEDDDGGENTNSRLAFQPPGDDVVRLIVATFDGSTGAFVLEVRLQTEKEIQHEIAKALEAEGKSLIKAGKFKEAEGPYRKALEIRLKHQGEEDAWTLANQHQLAFVVGNQGKHAEAEALNRQVLKASRKVLGNENPETIGTLSNLAFDLANQLKYREAEVVLREVADLRKKVLGLEHLDTMAALHNLAYNLGIHQSKHQEAEAINRQVVELRRKVLGENHLLTAQSLNNLANNLRHQNRYGSSEAIDRQVLAFFEKTVGREHLDTGISLHNLAEDMASQGKYGEAETYYRQALAIFRKVRGEEHFQTTIAMASLGANFLRQGRYRDAETLQRQVIAIRRKILGENHPLTALALNHLAIVLTDLAQHEEALALNRQALAIQIKVLGEDHEAPDSTRNNLAICLSNLGIHEEAEGIYRLVLEKRLNQQDPNHLATAISLNNLAFSLRGAGKSAEAEKLFRQALALRVTILGEQHAETGVLQLSLANLLLEQGKFEEAEAMALASARAFSEARVKAHLAGFERASFNHANTPYPLAAALLAKSGKFAQAWQLLEQNRARALFDELAARTQRPLTAEERTREETLVAQFDVLERRLPGLLSGKNQNSTLAAELREQQGKVQVQLSALQSELAKKYGAAAGQVYDLERVQSRLASDAALVAWLQIAGHPKALEPGGQHWAVVLRSKGEPIWIRLVGSGENGAWLPIDTELPNQVRKELQHPDSSLDPGPLLAKLAKQRLKPLEPHLDGINHLIVLPSLAMIGIPIEPLTQRFRISYAPSATMFAWLEEGRARPSAKGNLLALGDPAFTTDQAATDKNDLLLVMRGLSPKPLPCTRVEVEAIAKMIRTQGGKAETLLGPSASERGLEKLFAKESLASFRFLHLATHGHPNTGSWPNSYLALTPDDPDLDPEGRLTAGQIMRSWKLNADLVTLSACSSALGQQLGGEGYVGFAQALFLAGARSLVLSQWQVSDHATSLLMVRFYQNLLGQREGLKTPMTKLDSLGEARDWLKTLKHDDAARLVRELPNGAREIARWEGEEHPYAHPNYWAAFILIGAP